MSTDEWMERVASSLPEILSVGCVSLGETNEALWWKNFTEDAAHHQPSALRLCQGLCGEEVLSLMGDGIDADRPRELMVSQEGNCFLFLQIPNRPEALSFCWPAQTKRPQLLIAKAYLLRDLLQEP